MSLNLDLTGRTALVCGASRGIGRATALQLASLGCSVIAAARSEDKLLALCDELLAAGAPSASALVLDLDNTDALGAIAAETKAEILVHNTGGPPGGPLTEATPDALAHAFRRHVMSAQVLVRALLPHMQEQGYGRIITVTSTSVREPIPNLGVSNTIRAAMASWGKSLSRELPSGVTINNVMPGFTDTQRLGELAGGIQARTGKSLEDVHKGWMDQVPEGRMAEPSETGGVIAFLCSPAGAYIRGVSLAVDGGRLRSI